MKQKHVKKSKKRITNFDRFTDYHDAVDAWHKEERCCGKRINGGTCEKDQMAIYMIPLCFGKWLYSKVEKDS